PVPAVPSGPSAAVRRPRSARLPHLLHSAVVRAPRLARAAIGCYAGPAMDLSRLAAGALYRPDSARAPVRFAAAELRAYLTRLFGDAPGERPVAGATGAWLHPAPPEADSPPETP